MTTFISCLLVAVSLLVFTMVPDNYKHKAKILKWVFWAAIANLLFSVISLFI